MRARGRRNPGEHEPAERGREAGEGVEQAVDVLVRERVPHEQEVRRLGPERGERRVAPLGGVGRPEGRADAVRDHADPLGARAQPVDEVPARRFRDRDEPPRAPHREPQHDARVERRDGVAVPQRKPQVDQVVDRHHRRARQERRTHVVRRVKEVGAVPARGAGELPELGQGVGPRRHRAPVGARSPGGRRRRRRIAARREVGHQGLGPARRRKRVEQALDVRPDPEVVDLPGVESEPHRPRCAAS